ncbi:hypothetical protein B566_EDAN006431 [Ephemera danica]|nr:hypothetical protein B566_EDAN006431 [Ephemera danica]
MYSSYYVLSECWLVLLLFFLYCILYNYTLYFFPISEQLCISADSNAERFPKNLELIQEIIAEFVFCEIDKRGNKKRIMKSTAELSLLEVLSDHFSKASPNSVCAARNSLFLWLFHPAAEARIRVLSKLVSLSISTRRVSVLSTAGLWMQCTLPTSPRSTVNLANMLVKDFFILTPQAAVKLRELPQLAPLFTANLLTAFTAMFGVSAGGSYVAPPPSLLKVVTQWVSDHPHLCLTPLLQPGPGTGVSTEHITPVVGLFRWCVLSPLYGVGHLTEKDHDSESSDYHNDQLYSCLHISLLQGLLTPLHGLVPGQQVTATHADELSCLVDDVCIALKASTENDEARQLALDRLGQAIQTAISSLALLSKVSHLPQTRLLSIILSKNIS